MIPLSERQDSGHGTAAIGRGERQKVTSLRGTDLLKELLTPKTLDWRGWNRLKTAESSLHCPWEISAHSLIC